MELEEIIKKYIENEIENLDDGYCMLSRKILCCTCHRYLCSEEFERDTKKFIMAIKGSVLKKSITLYKGQEVYLSNHFPNIMEKYKESSADRGHIYSDELCVGALLPMGICSFSSDEQIVNDRMEFYCDDALYREANPDKACVKFKIVTKEAFPIFPYVDLCSGEKLMNEYLMYGWFQIVGMEDDTYVLRKIDEMDIDDVCHFFKMKDEKENIEKKIYMKQEEIKKLKKKLRKKENKIYNEFECIAKKYD